MYIGGSELCHRIKALRHARYALNMPLPPPSCPWEGLTMDFITKFPESTESEYTGIVVIIDRVTKMATYLLCRKDIDSPALARMVFKHVICKHGVPDNLTTDRGKEFTSQIWDRVCSHHSINHWLSTLFHPQTDGQTERQSETMEQYLRAFCNYGQDNWVQLLPLAEFAYNNSILHSALMTPFWANYKYHPTMQFKPAKNPSFISQVQADSWMTGMEETHQILWENIFEAHEHKTQCNGRKEMTFAVGDKLWLWTKNLRTYRISKKLNYKHTGLYTASKIINKNTYNPDLPRTMRTHNVFHVLLLDCYTPPVRCQPLSVTHPVIVDETEDLEVDHILDSRRHYRKLHYIIKWAGNNNIRTTWEPADHLQNPRYLVEEFHREYSDCLRE